jgi:hypothetical protein
MKKSDVQFHSEGYGRNVLPAVNVKYYGPSLHAKVQDTFKCSQEIAEQALGYVWESACEQFWREAKSYVPEILGRGEVWSEGRSGGWLVVSGLPDIETWDAIQLGKWAKVVKFCEEEIAYLSSWEYVKDAIGANEWAKEGAEAYNFMDLEDGRTVTMAELKTAHLPPQ